MMKNETTWMYWLSRVFLWMALAVSLITAYGSLTGESDYWQVGGLATAILFFMFENLMLLFDRIAKGKK